MGDAVVMSMSKALPEPVIRPEFINEHIADAHTVIVKSRGHFRAGFDIWFSHERTYEIDTAGLTSPVLERWDFTRIPRPSYPFDQDAKWTAEYAV